MLRARHRWILLAAAGIAVVGQVWWGVIQAVDAGWFDACAVPVTDDVARAMLTDLTRWDAATSGERRGVAERVERSLAAERAWFTLLRVRPFGFGEHRHEIAVFRHRTTGLEFSLIPGGTFTMGSPATELGRAADETRHQVTITRPFLIAQTECTLAAFAGVSRPGATDHQVEVRQGFGGDEGRKSASRPGANHPAEFVSWSEVEQVRERTGLRLPTEAEWEFACRAGTSTAFWSGDDDRDLDRVGWHGGNTGPGFIERALSWMMRRSPVPILGPRPVAQLPANPFGLHDTHGNVWEWCSDGYAPYPTPSVTDPAGPADPTDRVLRGGCWGLPARAARSAQRARITWEPNSGELDVGFRPARSVTP